VRKLLKTIYTKGNVERRYDDDSKKPKAKPKPKAEPKLEETKPPKPLYED
jgi:hypothetical protein